MIHKYLKIIFQLHGLSSYEVEIKCDRMRGKSVVAYIKALPRHSPGITSQTNRNLLRLELGTVVACSNPVTLHQTSCVVSLWIKFEVTVRCFLADPLLLCHYISFCYRYLSSLTCFPPLHYTFPPSRAAVRPPRSNRTVLAKRHGIYNSIQLVGIDLAFERMTRIWGS